MQYNTHFQSVTFEILTFILYVWRKGYDKILNDSEKNQHTVFLTTLTQMHKLSNEHWKNNVKNETNVQETPVRVASL